MKVSAKWIGLKEANAALKRLPEHVRPAVQQTIDVTAFQIARGAQARVRRRTGTLLRNIEWQSRPRSLAAIVGIGVEAWYWKYLEFGTIKMPAFPFLRPAAEAIESDHEQRMVQALEQAKTRMEQEGSVK